MHPSPRSSSEPDSISAFAAMRTTRRNFSGSMAGYAAMLTAAAVAGAWPHRAAAAPTDGSAAALRDYQTEEGAAARALVPEASGPLLEVYPAGALHVVGQERFALGVVDPESGPIDNAQVDLLFFKLANNQGTLTETVTAPFLPYGASEGHAEGHADHDDQEVTGIYVARPTFDAPGTWGVVVRATMPDGTVRAGQVDFTVDADTEVPGPGDPAMPSKTLVASTPEETAKICTADPVDDMHGLSLDEALKNGKPTVLLFATPALCTSRVCGPSLEATVELKKRYGSGANFVHVEIYPERDYNRPATAIDEWRLPSEPWLFLIDADGKVVERYEGGMGLAELDPAVQQLVGA